MRVRRGKAPVVVVFSQRRGESTLYRTLGTPKARTEGRLTMFNARMSFHSPCFWVEKCLCMRIMLGEDLSIYTGASDVTGSQVRISDVTDEFITMGG
jgi:hypothetical protein